MTISIASLLKQQSPSRHFVHGWIELPGGQRWNPGRIHIVEPRKNGGVKKWFRKRGASI